MGRKRLLTQGYRCHSSSEDVHCEPKSCNDVQLGRNDSGDLPNESGRMFRTVVGRILALPPLPSLELLFPGE